MKIDNEVKNQIRKYNMMQEFEKSYKLLFKLYNKKRDTVLDNFFVVYNISLTTKKLGRIAESKKYIVEIKEFMDDKEGFMTEKGFILWLYMELLKNELTKEEKLINYRKLKQYFSYLEEDDEMVIGIKGSIEIIQENYVEVENLISLCFNKNYIEMANNILSELKELNEEKYFMIVNKYIIKDNQLA